jgi:hypothetical protein
VFWGVNNVQAQGAEPFKARAGAARYDASGVEFAPAKIAEL